MTDGVDVIVLGSGFGGSLLSAILAKHGLTVVMLDRTSHPRFTIGESSTPLADRTLLQIAQEFELPQIQTLTQYGTWKLHHPNLVCGLKRGFTYFGHADGGLSSHRSMLVAASRSDEHADTHWLRSDVDAHFFKLAKSVGVFTTEHIDPVVNRCGDEWHVRGTHRRGKLNVRAPFLVDATGNGQLLLHPDFNGPQEARPLQTQSYALYAHFRNVVTNSDLLGQSGESTDRHPFPCDAAAVHHVLEDGWMWQLRFDDDSVSAGFCLHGDPRDDVRAAAPPEQQWQELLNRSPVLQEQFRKAKVIRPQAGIQRTGRLQRIATAAAGSCWAALPASAGFIDPLHSTGIAHTLAGVRRLSRILLDHRDDSPTRQQLLHTYSAATIRELRFIDQLVEGCYAALPDFELWCDWCMLYFAAVISMEQAEDDSSGGAGSFLRSNDTAFQTLVRDARRQLQHAVLQNQTSPSANTFRDWLRTAIDPWNHTGLLDPSEHPMYASTAAPTPFSE